MNVTVTANFGSDAALKMAVNELIGAGIPGEQFYVDEENHQIKVITPADGRPEIVELLNRHHPKTVH